MCLYRDVKNFERFNLVVQSMIYLAVHHLKHIKRLIEDYKKITASAAQAVAQAQGPTPTEKSNDETGAASTSSGSSTASKENNKNETKDVAEDKSKTKDVMKSPKKGEKADSKTSSPGDDNANNNTSLTASPSCGSSVQSSQSSSGASASTSSSSTSSSAATSSSSSAAATSSSTSQHTEEPWILPEVEKLLLLVSKVFLLNFPLYIAYKHGTHARLDDISAEEAQHLAIFCDLHDNEIPVYVLRNTSLFCNSNGFAAMMLCFDQPDLPVTTAHAIVATVSNIKIWLHYGCIVQLFVPLRSKILQYMCKLPDQSLRTAATRAMADFVWAAVRDPLDSTVSFDVEGLALAFKYFTSTTLTMRLAGKLKAFNE